jgi:hypothetical protein
MKFAVVSSLLCLCRHASALETEELASFGGRPLTNWNAPPALVLDKWYGEKIDLEEGVQVIHNFLDPQELAYFNALAEAATREKAPGRFIHSAPHSAKLVQRFNAVWLDEEFCTEDAEAPVMVEVSKLFSDIDLHADHLPNDLLMSGYTALVVLTDSQNALVWGESTRVPLVANSLILFPGNTTHGIPMEFPDDPVRFLGPFRLQDFFRLGLSPTAFSLRFRLLLRLRAATLTAIPRLSSLAAPVTWMSSFCARAR